MRQLFFPLFFKGMHPVRSPKEKQEHDRAAGPGQRIGPGDGPKYRKSADRQRNVKNADAAPEGQHRRHGHDRFPAAAHDAGAAVRKRQQKVKRRNDVNVDQPIGDRFVHIHEKPKRIGRPQKQDHADQLRRQHTGKDPEKRASLRPAILLRPQILSDKGGQRHGHTGNGQKNKALDLGISAVPGHGKSAKSIDVGLDREIADADNRILDPGRQALRQNLADHRRVPFQFPKIQAGIVREPAHTYDAQYSAQPLRQYGGKGRAAHAPVKSGHKEKIQNHICQGRYHQVIQRMNTVPEGAHDRHADIVKDNRGNAAKINPEVSQGMGHDGIRRVHQPQDQRRQQKPDPGGNNRRNDPEEEVGVNGFLHAFFVPRPVITGDDNAAADSDPVKKTDDQKRQAAAGTDRRKGVIVREIADDPGVRQIV